MANIEIARTVNAQNVHENRQFWTCIKGITGIFCVAGFCVYSIAIFYQFISGRTITSHNIDKHSKLWLPSITLCNISGFKKPIDEHADIEFDKYLNYTIELHEIISVIWYTNQNGEIEYNSPPFNNSKLFTISTTFSAFKGRCYTIEYKKKVM